MKTVFYIRLLLFATVSIGQGQESAPVAYSFPDSLRIVMENSRNTDAGVVGGMITSAWGNIDLVQQECIKQQTTDFCLQFDTINLSIELAWRSRLRFWPY